MLGDRGDHVDLGPRELLLYPEVPGYCVQRHEFVAHLEEQADEPEHAFTVHDAKRIAAKHFVSSEHFAYHPP